MHLPPLKPFQLAGIEFVLARPAFRAILAMATGAGKTRTALEIARRLNVKRLLVLGSAQSRAVWPKEAEFWTPELALRSVRFGKGNKSLTKKEAAEREAAYAAPMQVCSFALAKHLDGPPPDLLIVDEAHALKSPTSRQGRLVREYVHANPQMPVLLLTATPAPREIQDIWHLVETIAPGYLGEPTDTHDVPWSFKRQYCLSKEGWQGRKVYYGANTGNLPRLAKKLEPLMFRVSDAEVAAHTPKLNANILWVDEPKIKDFDIATDWMEGREFDESTHIGLFAWTHDTAHKLADAARARGWPVTLITGHMHPEQRAMALEAAAASPRACIVGTAGSLAESISLSFIKQALVFEWRTTPGQAIQFSGRFARQDSKTMAPTYLLYVARTDDETEAKLLRTRLGAAAALYEQDFRASELQELMAPREMTEERLVQLSAAMFAVSRVSLGGFLEEDEDE